MASVEAACPQDLHTLYSDHHGWLQGWLRKRLSNSSDAADLAQDTFLRLIAVPNSGERARDIREPRSYLTTIARCLVVDHYRRQTLERAYLEALAAMPEHADASPEARRIILETLCEIDAMLDGLGIKAKQAFLMSQLEGMGYAEIALRLGVSTSSVKKYVARAVERCLLMAMDIEL